MLGPAAILERGKEGQKLPCMQDISFPSFITKRNFRNDEDTYCYENAILLATMTQKKPICNQIMLWVG